MNHMRLILLFGCVWLLALQGVFGQSSLYLKAPFDAAVFSTEQDSIKFTWNQISGASSYTVQLSNDPGFGTFTAYASTTGTRWIQQADLTGTGYWRVVSSNAVFSVVRSFSLIDLTALGSPYLPHPCRSRLKHHLQQSSHLGQPRQRQLQCQSRGKHRTPYLEK
jgi:hypothetical protein